MGPAMPVVFQQYKVHAHNVYSCERARDCAKRQRQSGKEGEERKGSVWRGITLAVLEYDCISISKQNAHEQAHAHIGIETAKSTTPHEAILQKLTIYLYLTFPLPYVLLKGGQSPPLSLRRGP